MDGSGDVSNHPYDDENGPFWVLVNDADQYSVWPASDRVPAGWRPVFGPDARDQCLHYVEDTWPDTALVAPPRDAEQDTNG